MDCAATGRGLPLRHRTPLSAARPRCHLRRPLPAPSAKPRCKRGNDRAKLTLAIALCRATRRFDPPRVSRSRHRDQRASSQAASFFILQLLPQGTNPSLVGQTASRPTIGPTPGRRQGHRLSSPRRSASRVSARRLRTPTTASRAPCTTGNIPPRDPGWPCRARLAFYSPSRSLSGSFHALPRGEPSIQVNTRLLPKRDRRMRIEFLVGTGQSICIEGVHDCSRG